MNVRGSPPTNDAAQTRLGDRKPYIMGPARSFGYHHPCATVMYSCSPRRFGAGALAEGKNIGVSVCAYV